MTLAMATPSAVQAHVLVNPHAAGGRAEQRLPQLRQLLTSLAPQASLHTARRIDEALQLVRSWPPGSRVILAGGDGTVHRMLPAIIERGHEMGLLPCGTGNDTARAFGVQDLDLPQALRFALERPARPTDVGELDCAGQVTLFASSLAAGFDAAVAQRALQAPAWLRGMPRYLFAMAGELGSLRRFDIQAWVDDQPIHQGDTLFASTLNTRSYGSGMPIAPNARIDDGRLDLVLAGRFGALGALAMMPLLLTGLHTRHPRVALRAFSQLRLHASTALPLAADGENLADARSLTIRVRTGAWMAVRQP